MLESDLDVFFNIDEFAEKAKIENLEVPIISLSEELKELQLKEGEGLYRVKALFCVRASSLPRQPAINKTMNFNGDRYTVMNSVAEGGTYTVTLGVKRQ